MHDMNGARQLAEIDRLRIHAARNRRWADCDLVLTALMTVLCLIGLVMVLSASSVQSLRQYGSPWHYFERQAMWLGLGFVAFAIASRVDYRRWRRLGWVGVVVAIALMLAVLVPSVGVNGGGSARWIGVGSWRLQPSELAKLALVVFSADVLDRRSGRIGEWRYSMGPVLLAFLAMAVLVMAQPDMGTTMILACILVSSLYVAGLPLRPLATLVAAGAASAFVAAKTAPYRWRRMTAFWHPFADTANTGYQAAQGVVALGSGRLFGLGLGATRAATGYLPNQYTDFIYAIIGEETGLLGSLAIVGLFVVLAVVGIRVACRAPDRFGSILTAGITAWLVGQAVINMGAVVGLVPVSGVPLPFVSFGGSSLILAMAGLGICCNVARQSLRGPRRSQQRRSRLGGEHAGEASVVPLTARHSPADRVAVAALRPPGSARGGAGRRAGSVSRSASGSARGGAGRAGSASGSGSGSGSAQGGAGRAGSVSGSGSGSARGGAGRRAGSVSGSVSGSARAGRGRATFGRAGSGRRVRAPAWHAPPSPQAAGSVLRSSRSGQSTYGDCPTSQSPYVDSQLTRFAAPVRWGARMGR